MYKFNLPYTMGSLVDYGWDQFAAFANGKSTFEVWYTMPVGFIFSPWGFFCSNIIALLQKNPGIISDDHVRRLSESEALYFESPTQARMQARYNVAEFTLSEILEGAIVSDAPKKLAELIRQDSPFREAESWWVRRYGVPKTSPMDLLTEAIRLGDMTTAKTAWGEVTADACMFDYFD